MLTIRPDQLRVFENQHVRNLVPELLAHARTYHPGWSSQLDPAALPKFVDTVVESAVRYRLSGLRSVARLLDLAIIFGLPFPAAMEKTLGDTAVADPKRRLDRAWRQSLFRLEAGR